MGSHAYGKNQDRKSKSGWKSHSCPHVRSYKSPIQAALQKYGAALVFSEMASSEAIIRLNEKSKTRLLSCTEERPLGIQLMGSSADNLVRSALFVQEKYNPDIIDVNLGCPAQEIIKNGCGSALLKKPGLIRDIISGLSGSINVPLTAKMRILDNYDDSLKIARTIEKAGADALIVHGRTQKQQYSGKSNIEIIKKIKKELSIPVLANGDIVDELSARNVLEYTGCDGLMIGRAAMGNPYIFRRISYYLDEGNFPSPVSMDSLMIFLNMRLFAKNMICWLTVTSN